MNSIIVAATTFWNFIWPSVIHLGITIYIILFICPQIKSLIKQRLLSIKFQRLIKFLHSKTAEVMGLPKLVPISLVFLFLLGLVIINDLAKFVGSNTPPVLIYTGPYKYLSVVSDKHLQDIWQALPDESDLHDLSRYVSNAWEKNRSSSGFSFWEKKAHKTNNIIHHLKFYLVLVWVLTILVIINNKCSALLFLRFIKAITLLLLLYSISITYAIHCQKSLIRGQLIEARGAANVQSTTKKNIKSNVIELRQQMLECAKKRDMRWWTLSLPSWTW